MKIDAASLMNLLTPSKASEQGREDRQAAAAEARLREAQAAAETLKKRSGEAQEQRKAQARQKIQQLKAQLQMLQSMAAADPEGAARIASRLARELGAALKAYAAAGGAPSGMDASATAAAATPSGGESAPAGDAAQVTPQAGESDAGTASSEDRDDGAKSVNPYQQAMDEQKAQAADAMRRSGEKQADDDFMNEVRRLAAQIKQLVRQATEQAPDEEAAVAPQEAREMKAALADMDQSVQQASADLGGGGVSLLV